MQVLHGAPDHGPHEAGLNMQVDAGPRQC